MLHYIVIFWLLTDCNIYVNILILHIDTSIWRLA